MSPILPKQPNLDHLRKSAKQILAAHRNGQSQCCALLRRLQRFQALKDEEILAARVTLQDTQYLVALVYGFESWDKLKRFVRARSMTNEHSIESVVRRCRPEIPEYAGPGVPLAVAAALIHAGVDIDYMELAAASGWAFSFGYRYDSISPSHMAVRGDPDADGPFEVFSFLPDQLGFDYEHALTADADAVWDFARHHIDAGTPIMSEHLDGGLITGYREDDGRRRIYFDGTVGSGWLGAGELQPHAIYVLTKRRDALPREMITKNALLRAVDKGLPHTWRDTPQGLAALHAYLADVEDPAKGFEKVEEWFCWSTFSRLMARRCCEVWLRSVAGRARGKAGDLLGTAAEHFGQAFAHYNEYLVEVRGADPDHTSLEARARKPERISVIAPLLRRGIDTEAAGLRSLSTAMGTLV